MQSKSEQDLQRGAVDAAKGRDYVTAAHLVGILAVLHGEVADEGDSAAIPDELVDVDWLHAHGILALKSGKLGFAKWCFNAAAIKADGAAAT